ncbi:MAG: LysR family transcriptional regulator [Clostridiales bacterium]|nr:LysR family transcriptional regulator [Clostridiales bacterium]
MTYQQLIYFCTACECGSVTKAAEKLFVTQPAIRHLEKEYHLQILERKDKNMRLTPDGKIFLEHAKNLV